MMNGVVARMFRNFRILVKITLLEPKLAKAKFCSNPDMPPESVILALMLDIKFIANN